jgi:hypothetical protein
MTMAEFFTALGVGLAFAAIVGLPIWYAYTHPPKD